MNLGYFMAVSKLHLAGFWKAVAAAVVVSLTMGLVAASMDPVQDVSFLEKMFGTAAFLGHQFFALSVGYFAFHVARDLSGKKSIGILTGLVLGFIALLASYGAVVKASGDRWSWGSYPGMRGGFLEVKP